MSTPKDNTTTTDIKRWRTNKILLGIDIATCIHDKSALAFVCHGWQSHFHSVLELLGCGARRATSNKCAKNAISIRTPANKFYERTGKKKLVILDFCLFYFAWPRVSSGSDGLYLSPLSDMSPATSDCLEPYFSGFLFFSFLFQLSRVCWLFWVLLFPCDFFHNVYPFWVVSLWPQKAFASVGPVRML